MIDSEEFKSVKKSNKVRRVFQQLKVRIDGTHQHSNILLKDYKAIYFSIPKVASRSLREKFANVLDIDGETPYSISFPYAKKSELNSQYSNFFKFGFVRNPWDRLVSVYFGKFQNGIELNQPFYKAKIYHVMKIFKVNTLLFSNYPVLLKDMDFDQFVEAVYQIPDESLDKHLRSQYTFFPINQEELRLDYIGKVESLKEDLEFIFEKIGLDNTRLRYRGYKKTLSQSKKKPLKPFPYYYNEHTWNLVRERFKTDIELFDYDETWQEALARYKY
jgi:hypothetical protein